MKDDVLELITDRLDTLQADISAIRTDVTNMRLGTAFSRGKENGRSTVIAAIAGFLSGIFAQIFSGVLFSFLHLKKP